MHRKLYYIADLNSWLKQAWLALVSSSNDFQMTFAFEFWVTEDNFWRAPHPHSPPWVKFETTHDCTWLILTPEAIRQFWTHWSAPWCPSYSPTWSLPWSQPGSPDLLRLFSHTILGLSDTSRPLKSQEKSLCGGGGGWVVVKPKIWYCSGPGLWVLSSLSWT